MSDCVQYCSREINNSLSAQMYNVRSNTVNILKTKFQIQQHGQWKTEF